VEPDDIEAVAATQQQTTQDPWLETPAEALNETLTSITTSRCCSDRLNPSLSPRVAVMDQPFEALIARPDRQLQGFQG
jgi:hypothetical protein